jgi:hypothetical protein
LLIEYYKSFILTEDYSTKLQQIWQKGDFENLKKGIEEQITPILVDLRTRGMLAPRLEVIDLCIRLLNPLQDNTALLDSYLRYQLSPGFSLMYDKKSHEIFGRAITHFARLGVDKGTVMTAFWWGSQDLRRHGSTVNLVNTYYHPGALIAALGESVVSMPTDRIVFIDLLSHIVFDKKTRSDWVKYRGMEIGLLRYLCVHRRGYRFRPRTIEDHTKIKDYAGYTDFRRSLPSWFCAKGGIQDQLLGNLYALCPFPHIARVLNNEFGITKSRNTHLYK